MERYKRSIINHTNVLKIINKYIWFLYVLEYIIVFKVFTMDDSMKMKEPKYKI